MRRRRRGRAQINSDGWMISYGDMVTILLAIFIVLSTLNKDQTGLSLYNGTGSFVHALTSFGLPGFFRGTNRRALAGEAAGPGYLYEPPAGGSEDLDGVDAQPASDPDPENLRIFLKELERKFHLERLPQTSGQVIIDVYEALNKKPPVLKGRHTEVLEQVKPLLEQANYQVYLVVWAPSPSPAAWTRAAQDARQAVAEFAAVSQLDVAARSRLIPLAQPWRYRDIRRPFLSLILDKRHVLDPGADAAASPTTVNSRTVVKR